MPLSEAEIDALLDPVLAAFDATLTATVSGHAVTAYLQGSAELTSWGRTASGRPLLFEGPPIKEATDYARQRGARLVTGMNEETKRRLGGVISRGIDNKRGIDGIARDLRQTFDDMTMHRSQLIARTETSEALQSAFIERSESMGVTGKESIPVAPVDADCLNNADIGVIPMDEAFPSGHQAPPYHPACVCALAPSIL